MTQRPIADLLDELRTSEEHARLEAKRNLGDSALDTVIAFSNEPGLGGGTILFGVVRRDGRYQVVGVDHPERLTEQLQSQVTDETLNRPVRPRIWTDVVESKAVVAAFVPEARSSHKPIYLRRKGLPRGAFRRIGNGDVRCSDDDLRVFHQLSSDRPYEDELVGDAMLDELDPGVIAGYRRALIERNPATELRDVSVPDAVRALGGAREVDNVTRPTVAGVLLFGTPLVLRRLFPAFRIDYIRVPGVRWVEDTTTPFDTLDVRQPLLIAFRKVYQAILDDLPRTAEIRAGSPERTDTPTVPERVVREALVNAICHRDYRVQSPIQVRRYADRLEIENPGHSLVSEDRFGEPGSESRNPRIADVFREMGLAENKGTGIRVMRREMERAHLTRPLFYSSREHNRFVATLLFARLLDAEHLEWLDSLQLGPLTDGHKLALVYCRQLGEIRNSSLRDITGLDTLAASAVLRDLRDRGLLESRGASVQTHYVLAPAIAEGAVGGAEETREQRGEQAEKRGESGQQRGEFAEKRGESTPPQLSLFGGSAEQLFRSLPEQVQARVRALKKWERAEALRALIVDLCRVRPMSPSDLSALLGRKVKTLVERHLGPLVREGRLERTHPDTPNHPDQAYRASLEEP